MKNQLKIRTVLVFLSVLLVFCSCEKTNPEKEVTFFDLQGENGFVGTVDGTNAYVSILLGEEEGIAYVCDGDEAISEWFNGSVSNVNEIRFTNNDGAKITASLIDDAFKGKISFRDGRGFRFIAVVNTGNYGGMYKVLDEKAVEAEIEGSWIVISEEEQRGAFKFEYRFLPNIILSKEKSGGLSPINNGASNTFDVTSFSIFRYKVKAPTSSVPPIPIPYPNTGG